MLSILATFLLIFVGGIILLTAGEYAVDWMITRIQKKYEQSMVHNEQES